MSDETDGLCVAILAGGRSSRMGVDKALLPWGNGQLIDQVIRVAEQVKGTVDVIVVGDRPEYHGRGARVVADLFPGAGPLGGIATALRSSPGDRVLILAVDMPMLSIDLLNAMALRQFGGDAQVPRVEAEPGSAGPREYIETLHAIYRRSCLPAIESRLREGRLKIVDAFDELSVDYLDGDWLRRYDPELRSFENANTPGDYSRIKSSRDEGPVS